MDPSCLAPENYYTRITRPPGAPTPALPLSSLRLRLWATCGLRAGVDDEALEELDEKLAQQGLELVAGRVLFLFLHRNVHRLDPVRGKVGRFAA